ncbi:MAG: hypothetical protein PGN11_04055 [Quadrisphaera sp.]
MTLTLIPVFLSAASLSVSLLTYLRGRQKTQMQLKQQQEMRVLAARAVVFWDRTQTFVSAQVHEFEVSRHQRLAARSDARRLADQLDVVIGLGLLREVVTDRKNGLPLYAAFCAALEEQAEMDLEAPLEDWTRQHLVMGQVRLLGIILNWPLHLVPEAIRGEMQKSVSRIANEAWMV